jgi:hypothetical protein
MSKRHRELREARRKYEAVQSMTGYDMVDLLAEQGWLAPVEVGRTVEPVTGNTEVLFECGPGSSDRARAWGAIGVTVPLSAEMVLEVEAGTRNLGKMAAEAAIKVILEREEREKKTGPVRFG